MFVTHRVERSPDLTILVGVSALLSLKGAVNSIYALVGVILSDRWVGRRLAASYPRTWGLAVPTSWFHRVLRRSDADRRG